VKKALTEDIMVTFRELDQAASNFEEAYVLARAETPNVKRMLSNTNINTKTKTPKNMLTFILHIMFFETDQFKPFSKNFKESLLTLIQAVNKFHKRFEKSFGTMFFGKLTQAQNRAISSSFDGMMSTRDQTRMMSTFELHSSFPMNYELSYDPWITTLKILREQYEKRFPRANKFVPNQPNVNSFVYRPNTRYIQKVHKAFGFDLELWYP